MDTTAQAGRPSKTKYRPLRVKRLPLKLVSDERRVITLPFMGAPGTSHTDFIERVMDMSDDEVDAMLAVVHERFRERHEDLATVFEEHFMMLARLSCLTHDVSPHRRQLLGSYFTMEYSLQSAALFNPSIVPHPDQSGVPEGSLKFIMSLRATGEGHVSSVVFRTGMIDRNGKVTLNPPPRFSARTRLAPDHQYVKHLFRRKLGEMGVNLTLADVVLNPLGDTFSLSDLENTIAETMRAPQTNGRLLDIAETLLWLARSNYQLRLYPGADVSHLVIFPYSDNESRGIEDLRLVRFVDDDQSATYFGTYTAYNGFRTLPMLLETGDFMRIRVHTLNGACALNKGMALFPRRINGHYAMCSRIDGHNLFIMYSDMVYFWESAKLLTEPKYPWELRIIGNCGSPIETREGWLLITHGVGPMRQYSIGAMLLDLDDPTRIVGRLKRPLLAPTAREREGYVPNVVYSCGSLVHGGLVYLPYAMSDTATSMATVPLDDLLARLRRSGP